MADKKYTIDDILRKFNKLEESVEDITCFIKDCCSKIPINVGEGFGIFKRLHKGKWEFKSLLAGNNVTITETNNEIVISSIGGETGTPAKRVDGIRAYDAQIGKKKGMNK